MKPKLLITFTLIVTLPLVVLGWLGVRFVRTETEMTQHRFTQVLEGQLRDIDADVIALLDERGRELMSLPLTSTKTPDEIRALEQVPAVNLEIAERALAQEHRLLVPRTVSHITGATYTLFIG